ncbi:MAG: hypothetical protein HFH49_14860 [Lachnospiraceae bacterium]|nr:hypothetical protein [Lachnospiraceae bacterium]
MALRGYQVRSLVDSLVQMAGMNFKTRSSTAVTDRIVTFSTCSYEFDGAKFVLLGDTVKFRRL